MEEFQKIDGSNNASNSGRRGRIVILLGAGFSIDQGYPTSDNVAKRLASITKNDFYFASDGTMCVGNNTEHEDNLYQNLFLFLLELIGHYVDKVGVDSFNYEEFYDAVNLSLRDKQPEFKPSFNVLNSECRKIGEKYTSDLFTYEQLLRRLPIMFNQVIGAVIRQEGMQFPFYNDTETFINNYPDYTNFLHYIKNQSASNIIDVFTLNHDLFFDSFKNICELKDEKNSKSLISDGFDDYGSEYFGVVEKNGCSYYCRLERYTGRYPTPIRLFKLHGSLDYVLCYKAKKTIKGYIALPLKYVKAKNGICPYEFYKTTRNRMQNEYCLTDYSESFLSGTISKTLHYTELFYKRLFSKFDNSIENAGKFVIIGYSGKDEEINKHIIEHFNRKKTSCTIIDFSPDADLRNLADKLNAKILTGKINEQILKVK